MSPSLPNNPNANFGPSTGDIEMSHLSNITTNGEPRQEPRETTNSAESIADGLTSSLPAHQQQNHATTRSTITGRLKKLMPFVGLMLTSAMTGGVIGSLATLNFIKNNKTASPFKPSTPKPEPKPTTVLQQGNCTSHYNPLYTPLKIGPYDVNLIQLAGLSHTAEILKFANDYFDQNSIDGFLDREQFSTDKFNRYENNKEDLAINISMESSKETKNEFLENALKAGVNTDFSDQLIKQDALIRFKSIWDNTDLSLSEKIEQSDWDLMFSERDWGDFQSAQKYQLLKQADLFWGDLPNEINEQTWKDNGFEAEGYGKFEPDGHMPYSPPATTLSKSTFLDRSFYSEKPLPNSLSKEDIEYYILNGPATGASESLEVGLSEVAYDTMNLMTGGLLFDPVKQPFNKYSSKDSLGEPFDERISPPEFVIALKERFDTASKPK